MLIHYWHNRVLNARRDLTTKCFDNSLYSTSSVYWKINVILKIYVNCFSNEDFYYSLRKFIFLQNMTHHDQLHDVWKKRERSWHGLVLMRSVDIYWIFFSYSPGLSSLADATNFVWAAMFAWLLSRTLPVLYDLFHLKME